MLVVLNVHAQELMRRKLNPTLASASELYLVHRLACTVEEPQRSFVAGKVRAVLRLRHLRERRAAKPFITPLLAHCNHKKSIERSRRKLILIDRGGAIPLHISKASVVEATLCSVKDILFIAKPFIQDFKFGNRYSCICFGL